MAGAARDRSLVQRSPLLDPRFLVALALLVANDRILKDLWPGLITGKLSDVVGMVVGPVVVAELLRRFGLNQRMRTVLGLALSGLFLTLIKVSTDAATLAERALEAATGTGHRIVVDPTDLLGLVGLIAAGFVLRMGADRQIPRQHASRSLLRGGALALGLVACLASSVEEPTVYSDIAVAEDGSLELRDSGFDRLGDENVKTSDDDGRTWSTAQLMPSQPGEITTELCLTPPKSLCIRIGPEAQVQERSAADEPWRTVWELDTGASWVTRFGVSGDLPTIRAFDIVELPNGTVVVAMGELDPIRRTADGRWTPSIADLREMPWAGAVAAALASLAFGIGAGLGVGRLRGPNVMALGVLAATMTVPIFLGLLSIVVDPSGTGGVLGPLVVFLLGTPMLLYAFVLSVTGLLRGRAFGDDRQRQTVTAIVSIALLGAVFIVAMLGLWANDLISWSVALWSAAVAVIGSAGLVSWLARRGADLSPLLDHERTRYRSIAGPLVLAVVATAVLSLGGPIGTAIGFVGGLGWLLYSLYVPQGPSKNIDPPMPEQP